jgi:FtsP/CotA-like multicopper oxidase with cupredoxin domain
MATPLRRIGSFRGPRALLAALGPFGLLLLLLLVPAPAGAQTVDYWIAAVPTTWNVVPNQRDGIAGTAFTPEETVFRTVVYRAYTPGWREPLKNLAHVAGDNDGIPGPLIKAEVGDNVRVHFKNMDTEFKRPHSMHFHGVRYAFGSDGAFIPGFTGRGANVKPGQSFTYRLFASDESAGVWPYHDHGPAMHDSIAGGLYGAMSIRAPGEQAPDREFVVVFAALHGFQTINGHAFVGNTPIFRSRIGELVQWDVVAMGDEFHTFHVHGHRWLNDAGVPEDVRGLGPAESFRVRWVEDQPGTWLYHCHVEAHMMAGMIGLYRVRR